MSADMDRTPQQMREDSLSWSRAGYPAVAVGRYRDAADQIERLESRIENLLDQLTELGSYDPADNL
jgi:hypothetical protein